jgi:high-affinity nickel-transport protein
MTTLPADWLALAAIVFLLGLKHGLDPDHLAAIDGSRASTRARAARVALVGAALLDGPRAGRDAGGVTVATSRIEWRAPQWLEDTGAWISIGFLAILGSRTSHAVLRTPRDEVVRPAGFRSRLFARFTQASHPVLIAAVGAAFAISFDTISQAVLFSLTGSHVRDGSSPRSSGSSSRSGWWSRTR